MASPPPPHSQANSIQSTFAKTTNLIHMEREERRRTHQGKGGDPSHLVKTTTTSVLKQDENYHHGRRRRGELSLSARSQPNHLQPVARSSREYPPPPPHYPSATSNHSSSSGSRHWDQRDHRHRSSSREHVDFSRGGGSGSGSSDSRQHASRAEDRYAPRNDANSKNRNRDAGHSFRKIIDRHSFPSKEYDQNRGRGNERRNDNYPSSQSQRLPSREENYKRDRTYEKDNRGSSSFRQAFDVSPPRNKIRRHSPSSDPVNAVQEHRQPRISESSLPVRKAHHDAGKDSSAPMIIAQDQDQPELDKSILPVELDDCDNVKDSSASIVTDQESNQPQVSESAPSAPLEHVKESSDTFIPVQEKNLPVSHEISLSVQLEHRENGQDAMEEVTGPDSLNLSEQPIKEPFTQERVSSILPVSTEPTEPNLAADIAASPRLTDLSLAMMLDDPKYPAKEILMTMQEFTLVPTRIESRCILSRAAHQADFKSVQQAFALLQVRTDESSVQEYLIAAFGLIHAASVSDAVEFHEALGEARSILTSLPETLSQDELSYFYRLISDLSRPEVFELLCESLYRCAALTIDFVNAILGTLTDLKLYDLAWNVFFFALDFNAVSVGHTCIGRLYSPNVLGILINQSPLTDMFRLVKLYDYCFKSCIFIDCNPIFEALKNLSADKKAVDVPTDDSEAALQLLGLVKDNIPLVTSYEPLLFDLLKSNHIRDKNAYFLMLVECPLTPSTEMVAYMLHHAKSTGTMDIFLQALDLLLVNEKGHVSFYPSPGLFIELADVCLDLGKQDVLHWLSQYAQGAFLHCPQKYLSAPAKMAAVSVLGDEKDVIMLEIEKNLADITPLAQVTFSGLVAKAYTLSHLNCLSRRGTQDRLDTFVCDLKYRLLQVKNQAELDGLTREFFPHAHSKHVLVVLDPILALDLPAGNRAYFYRLIELLRSVVNEFFRLGIQTIFCKVASLSPVPWDVLITLHWIMRQSDPNYDPAASNSADYNEVSRNSLTLTNSAAELMLQMICYGEKVYRKIIVEGCKLSSTFVRWRFPKDERWYDLRGRECRRKADMDRGIRDALATLKPPFPVHALRGLPSQDAGPPSLSLPFSVFLDWVKEAFDGPGRGGVIDILGINRQSLPVEFLAFAETVPLYKDLFSRPR